MTLPITREHALARLDAFATDAAADYGARRNIVDPAGCHDAVSRLSAALRRRLISEAEVVHAVLKAHPYPAVEKFIAEVFWRTYWKGWLEHHRRLWPTFVAQVQTERARLEGASARARAYRVAMEGRTGIEAFDHWADELQRTGYLHNWARMQVASIWVFTLGLPWQLGADWMYGHLLDADPASNTLSWRWVAGLHTAGKTYLADEERILAMTGGALTAKGLAGTAAAPEAGPAPERADLRTSVPPDPVAPTLVLLTTDDLSLETDLDLEDVRGVVIPGTLAASPANNVAFDDAAERAARHWGCEIIRTRNAGELFDAARTRGCMQIATGFATAGPAADMLAEIQPAITEHGITLSEHLRRWDALAWPYCTKGFFQLRSRIPDLLQAQGLMAVKAGIQS